VLNVEALMVRRRGSIACRTAQQPSQAWLESQLLQRLRAVDPRRPVWVGDVDAQVGELQLPGSMADALGSAPTAELEAPLEERVDSWIEDEPAWRSPSTALNALTSLEPAPDVRIVERWKSLLLGNLADLVASVLTDYLDRLQAARSGLRLNRPNGLAPLSVDSLKPESLALAVGAWQPTPEPAAT
jgi:tRNA 2-selenouridine synthase